MCSQAYVGFDRVNHSKSIFITTENHHARETFMLGPTFFLGPAVPSQFFHSRFATGYPVKNVMKKISIFFDEEVVMLSS